MAQPAGKLDHSHWRMCVRQLLVVRCRDPEGAVLLFVRCRDPEGAVLAFWDMMKKGIVMPAHLVDDGVHAANNKGANLFMDYATVADSTGVYTTADYADIVDHLVSVSIVMGVKIYVDMTFAVDVPCGGCTFCGGHEGCLMDTCGGLERISGLPGSLRLDRRTAIEGHEKMQLGWLCWQVRVT